MLPTTLFLDLHERYFPFCAFLLFILFVFVFHFSAIVYKRRRHTAASRMARQRGGSPTQGIIPAWRCDDSACREEGFNRENFSLTFAFSCLRQLSPQSARVELAQASCGLKSADERYGWKSAALTSRVSQAARLNVKSTA